MAGWLTRGWKSGWRDSGRNVGRFVESENMQTGGWTDRSAYRMVVGMVGARAGWLSSAKAGKRDVG